MLDNKEEKEVRVGGDQIRQPKQSLLNRNIFNKVL